MTRNYHTLLFTVLFSVFSVGLTAQESGPQISFETKSLDYGTIDYASDGVRTFVFTNTGDAPLTITNVKSSCGCTIPKKPSSAIAPGEKGEIQVKYDTKRQGPFRKTITVSSNAGNTPLVALKIGGIIAAPKKN
ncbi:MAG: DUF1573 domain-containing protein [Flavobacteriaceae bacterium]